MRQAAIAACLLVVVAGCAESKPAPVSQAFTDAVTGLLGQVAPGATPAFEAATCGAVLDAAPDEHVAMWADAEVSGVSPDDLRAAGIAAGWQPLRATEHDLAMLGPHDIRIALDGSTVRAELADCSIAGKHQELDGFHRLPPELTDAQATALAPDFSAASAAVRSVHDIIGVPADPAVFPESGRLDQASGLTLVACGEDAAPRGASWRAESKGELTTAADVADLERRVIASLDGTWTVDPRPEQPGYLKARHNGVELTVSMGTPANQNSRYTLTLMNSTCAPVAGS